MMIYQIYRWSMMKCVHYHYGTMTIQIDYGIMASASCI